MVGHLLKAVASTARKAETSRSAVAAKHLGRRFSLATLGNFQPGRSSCPVSSNLLTDMQLGEP